MGHFIINLPGNQRGDVRWGTIRKMPLFSHFLKSKKSNIGIKKGYIVTIDATGTEPKEYRLLKTGDGNWTSESDGGFQCTPGDEMSTSIKTAIDIYESGH